jgi:methionyl-tRNA formyltransferase
MMEAIDLVRAGKAPKIPQDHSKKTYESWFKKDVAEIDWAKPVAEVYNLIRAANPAPGAWSTVKGQKVDIFDSAKAAGSGKPGEVLSTGDQGIAIAAGGGAILAKRVRGADGKKIPAAEWAKSAGLEAGDTFDKPAPKSN